MSRIVQATTNGVARMTELLTTPLDRQHLPATVPTASPKRLRDLAAGKRSMARALARHQPAQA